MSVLDMCGAEGGAGGVELDSKQKRALEGAKWVGMMEQGGAKRGTVGAYKH